MKVVLIGADGQLGTDLVKKKTNHELVCLTLKDGDVNDAPRMKELIEAHQPQRAAF